MVRMEGLLSLRLLPGLSIKRLHTSTIPLFDLGGFKTRVDEAVCQLLLDMFENASVFPAADLGQSLCESQLQSASLSRILRNLYLWRIICWLHELVEGGNGNIGNSPSNAIPPARVNLSLSS